MKRISQIRFWRVGKPLFSGKSISGAKTNLTEDGEHIKTEIKETGLVSSLFLNIVKNLKISQFSNFDRIVQNIEDPNRNVIGKYNTAEALLPVKLNGYEGKNKFILQK